MNMISIIISITTDISYHYMDFFPFSVLAHWIRAGSVLLHHIKSRKSMETLEDSDDKDQMLFAAYGYV